MTSILTEVKCAKIRYFQLNTGGAFRNSRDNSNTDAAITGAAYDSNGGAWVNGTKYRRISKSDTNDDAYFVDSTYRYFKWERIKWRVLQNDGSILFVVADKR